LTCDLGFGGLSVDQLPYPKAIDGLFSTMVFSSRLRCIYSFTLTLRMHNRRFTRLTNAFSKKFESHVNMVALYTVWYNWVRIHKTLKVTSAMAAGLTGALMTMEDVVGLMDAVAPKPGRPKTYKKRVAA
jgi:hypothetical protein